jgi:cation-transporting P-type ATPase C
VRIKVERLRISADVRPPLERWLNRLDYVLKAEVRPTTGSVVLFYDTSRVEPDQVIRRLSRYINSLPNPHGALRRDLQSRCPAAGRAHGADSPFLVGHLVNTMALTAFLAYALVRRFFFRSPLSQRPLSLTGLVATVGSLPLLRRAWADLRQRKRMGLFPFLSAACILAVVTGEALTCLEIIWVLAIGMLLEEYVTERAQRAIRQILHVTPEKAYVLVHGVEVETPVSELRAGDTVVVRTGQKLPADGVIGAGEGLVDESHITGRWQPELRSAGDWVYAGTRIQEGYFHMQADKVGEETYLCRIAHLVETSLAERADLEEKADILAVRLMRLGIAATLGTLVFTRSLSRAFSVMLVMSCPCATVLAVSTAVTAAVASAASRHILVKGGCYLERTHAVNCICFDKTGTITSDVPRVVEVVPRAPGQDPSRILALAARAEVQSDHPLARALVEHARAHGAAVEADTPCEVFLGRGVRATVDSDTIVVGNLEFMESEGISAAYYKRRAHEHMQCGRTVVYVGRNGRLQGMIAVAGTARPGTELVLQRLRRDRIARLCLISGDTEATVGSISREMGFDEFRAALLPEDKAGYVSELEAAGWRVLMVGDGVNDALALSRATVGVAMGAAGSEVAVEASDIALMKDDLQGLVVLRLLSHRTVRTIEQNFWMANTTNMLGILLGACGLLSPVMAGIVHMGHTLGIMLNSARLTGWQAPRLDPWEQPRAAVGSSRYDLETAETA